MCYFPTLKAFAGLFLTWDNPSHFSSGDPLTSQSEDEDGRWEEIEMVCHGWYHICADVKALNELSTGPVPSTHHRGGYTSPFHRETS